MPRPVVTATAERLYTSLGPLVTEDEKHGWALLHFVEAVTRPIDELEVLSRDTAAGPGWSGMMDPDRAPAWALDWLGQFVGVPPLGGLTEASRRLRVKETAGFKRGTPAAIAGAARQYLTGTRRVDVFERDGSPYRLRVRTYLAETPADTTEIQAALVAQKPAGVVLTLEIQHGLTINELAGTIDGLAGTIDSYSNVVPA